MIEKMHETIAVVDNGGQFTHLIATKIRDQIKVRTVIIDPTSKPSDLEGVKGIILSGGPDSIHEDGSLRINSDIIDIDVPILGLCYGMHQIAVHYKGTVDRGEFKEYGYASLDREGDPIFKDVPQGDRVWMSHGDKVEELPVGFRKIGGTDNCPVAAFSDPDRRRWGFQYHPEVSDTVHGIEMLRNFTIDICGCTQDWTVEKNLEEIISSIKEEVGGRKVLTLVSGGVDSTVVAALISKALPSEQTRFIHVDTGLMRKNESAAVMEALREQGLKNLEIVDASDRYLAALDYQTEPEEKRKIIGRLFIDIINEAAEGTDTSDWILAQGTLYPDTIESGGTANADVIKTHHNRVDVIMKMIEEGRVIEPVKNLYKAEVREVGEMLGLPDELVHRHPFPGPGLGIRALCQDCSIIKDNLEFIDLIQDEVDQAIEADPWAKDLVTARTLPVRSVGVKGDARSYEHPVALWIDGEIPWVEVKHFATRLVNRTPGINRCILMMHPRDVFEACPMEGTINKERMDVLREVDEVVMDGLRKHGLYDSIWQCPTVLVPLSLSGGEMVVIRPVWSKRAMTAEVSELPSEFFDDVIPKLLDVDCIDSVAVDVTSKPPGTIEWE